MPAPEKAAGAIGARSAFSGRAPNTSSRWLGERGGVDRADGGDLQLVSREGRGAHVDQIGPRQRRQGREIAAYGQAIGMVRIGEGAKVAARDIVGIVRLALEAGGDLAHNPLERFSVETRLGDGEPQKFEGAGRIARQSLHASAETVAIGGKRDFDRILVEGAMKALRVVGSRSFVEQAGEKRGDARLADRVLRRAALEGEFEGDERNRVILDKPGLDAALRDDLLHGRGAGGDLAATVVMVVSQGPQGPVVPV